jgi:hypothetical protein
MRFPRRQLNFFAAVSLILAACTPSTAPVGLTVDPSVDFDAARAQWTAGHASAYTFEVETLNSMVPSIGYVRIDVVNGHVSSARTANTGAPVPLTSAFTIDDLWSRLLSARARAVTPIDVHFSREGIPVDAMVGSFANDSGVRYLVRSFVPHD